MNIKKFLSSLLFIALPAAPVFGATVWTAGDTTTGTPLDAVNWNNGTPTAANPGTITDAQVSVSTNFNPVTASGDSVSLTLAGTTKFSVTGTCIPFSAFSGITNGKGLLELTLTDTAEMSTTGNFWGGTNNNANFAHPLDGYDYAAYYTFGGNSTLTVDGELWIGMSAKAKVLIKDGATVTSKKGNSGIGWDSSSNDSLIEMTGGTLKAVSFYVTQTGTSGTMNQTGGVFTTSDSLILNKAGGKYTLSGMGASLNVGGTLSNAGTVLLTDGASAVVKTLTGVGTTTISKAAVAGITTWDVTGNDKISDGGIVNVATLNTVSGTLTIEGDSSDVNISNFYIGNTANSTGSVVLNSGTLDASVNFQTGIASGAGGNYTQTGGTLNYTGTANALFGTAANSNTVFNISGGNFNITSASLYLSDNDAASVTMNLSGTAALSTKEARIGQHGTATVTMDGKSTWTTNGSVFTIARLDAASNGTLEMKGESQLTTGDFRMSYADSTSNAGTSTLKMSGKSQLTINGTFIPYSNIQGKTNTGCVNVSLTDDAVMTVTGNFWGGTNDNTRYAVPQDGKDYAAYYTFSGNSKFTCAEWWVAMTAKSHILIEGNASVISNNGNSGLGWSGIGAAGSLLEMTGGTLSAKTFSIGNENACFMNQSGGTATFTTLNLATNSGASGSTLTLSGTGTLKADTMNLGNGGDGTLTMSGGTLEGKTVTVGVGASGTVTMNGANAKFNAGNLYIGSSAKDSVFTLQDGTLTTTTELRIGDDAAGKTTFSQSGGTVNAAGKVVFGFHNTGICDVNISGGTFNATSDILYLADSDATSVNLNLSGTGKLVAKQVNVAQHGTSFITMSGNSAMETKDFFMSYNYDKSDNAVSSLTMTDDASLKVTGAFIPFNGYNAEGKTHTGKGRVEVKMDGNSSIYVTGNLWTGANSGNAATPMDGEDYTAYYTFGGNSTLSCNEFWVAMSAKSHILIQDSASVTSRGGNSGIAWSENSNDSLLEMTGGTLKAPTFYVGNSDSSYGTLNISGGTAEFSNLYMQKLSDIITSGTGVLKTKNFTQKGTVTLDGGTIQAESLTNEASGTVQNNRGDLYATAINNAGTFNVAPNGRIQVGTIGAASGETLTLTGTADYNMGGSFVLDVFSTSNYDKIAYNGSGDLLFGEGAGVVLNLSKAVGINSSDTFEIDGWISGFDDLNLLEGLNVAVEGISNMTGYIDGNGNIIFGSRDVLPEPASVTLLLAGVFGLMFFRFQTQRKTSRS